MTKAATTTGPATGPAICAAELRWPGHPDGVVWCEGYAGHKGRHYFTWHMADGELHRIRWTDEMAAAVRRGDWPP